jgi:hypothetical protein
MVPPLVLALIPDVSFGAKSGELLKKNKLEGKDPLVEGKQTSGESIIRTKNNAALPFRAVASSRNPMNWEPRSMRYFIRGCQETKSGKIYIVSGKQT